MTDEPVRIEFTTNAQQVASAIYEINIALARIGETSGIAGGGIDNFVSRSTASLSRLSAEIGRVSTQLRTLSSAAPGMAAAGGESPIAPIAPVAQTTPVESTRSSAGTRTRYTSGALAEDISQGQVNIFSAAHEQAGAEAAAVYAKSIGSSYEEMAAKAGIATQATQQLGQAQQQAAPAAQQLSSATASLAPAAGNSARTLGELQANLSKAKANFDGSEASTKNLRQAYQQLGSVQKAAGDIAQEMGQKQGFLTSLFERQIARIAIGVAIWTTFRAVKQVIDEQVQALREYDLEVSRFAAITGQSVDSAKAKWDEYASIATKAGVKPMEAAPAIRVAELTPLKPGETNQVRDQFVRTVTQISEVTGVASDQISKGLSSALKQAGQGLGDVAHMGDLVATTLQRIPAANLDNVIAALQEAAPLAQLWGTSFDEAFNIIVEGASRVQESPEQISTAFQRLSKGLNEIGQGGAATWDRQSKLMDEFGLKVTTAEGKLRPIPEVLGEIARMLPGLSAPRQQALLETVAGGSLRPEQMRNLLGGIEAFNSDLRSATDKISGALDRMTEVIDKSLGQTVKVMDARIAQMREKSDILSNLFVSLLAGTVGTYGGKQGAEKTAEIAGLYSGEYAQPGTDMKEKFLKSLYGMTPDEAAKATKEWNDKVTNATAQQMRELGLGVLNPFTYQAAVQAESAIRVSDEEVAKALESGGKRVEGASTQRLASERRVQQQLSQTGKIEAGAAQAPTPLIQSMTTQRTPAQQQPTNPFLERAYATIFTQPDEKTGLRGLTGETIFPDMDAVNGSFDAIKNSMAQIVQAKQMSVQLTLAELEADRQLLISSGMKVEDANRYIEAQKKVLENSLLIVKTQRGPMALTGLEAARFQPAMQTINQRAQAAESNFTFQRHKEISPDQFGQLQALTAMYDAMLTKMGSPEKSKNINLLLGEENVFKTMTARLTALQMAMEDLTKVEKAQLSGTWNMPAGATALVPISSLDVQRWNKPAGAGGMSPEALMKLLEQMGLAAKAAETKGGGGGGGGYGYSYIEEQKAQDRKAMTAKPAWMDWADLPRRKPFSLEDIGLPAKQQTPVAPQAQPIQRQVITTLPDTAARQASAVQRVQAPPVTVNVSMLPIKAALTANLSVVMDGRVIARALMPLMYDMLTRAARGQSVQPRGVLR